MMKVNYERKKISTEVDGVHFDNLTLGEMQEKIDEFVMAYGPDTTVDLVPCEFSDTEYYLGVFQDIDESDEHMAFRIAQEEGWAATTKEHAMKQYLHLKKQLGLDNA